MNSHLRNKLAPRLRPALKFVIFPVACVIAAQLCGTLYAGGGPENVLLLVNANSDGSKEIANHYARLRGLPATNVVYIDWKGGVERCTGEEFREQILKPAIRAIEDRNLGVQIDYLAYSSDFPWQVDLAADFPDAKLPKTQKPVASLTGATYLWQYVMAKAPGLLSLHSNWYASLGEGGTRNLAKCQDLGNPPSRAFRGRYLWDQAGSRTNDAKRGQRYLLSSMLGVTSGRGNSVAEILNYLERSTAVDGLQPEGAFYYMKNGDVRSSTRHACFGKGAELLRAAGARAIVEEGIAPRDVTDVLGLTVGSRTIDLSTVQLAAGAICDNLTSSGGDLRSGAYQTPLTEFLRHGAAGASGTVVEPYAIQGKFPLPSLHVHYRRGCSLAEAFYQSVSGPFQLLIVGDPLCQPWARPPVVSVEGVAAGEVVTGKISITAKVASVRPVAAAMCEVFINGQLKAVVPPGRPVELDTTTFPEGWCELRVVASSGAPIESQGRWVAPIAVANTGEAPISLSAPGDGVFNRGGPVTLELSAPAAKRVVVRQFSRVVAEVGMPSERVELDAAELGAGPVRLQAFDADTGAASEPVWIRVL